MFPVVYGQKAWFYKPAVDATTTTLATYFINYVLTNGDETYREDLIAKGITSPFLQYVRFDAIQDPGSCTARPGKNQVANRPGDFCNISTNHPDWFLLDTNGQRMYNGNMVMMDPGNTSWRTFFLNRVIETQQLGWRGVFLDNVEGSLTKRRQYGQLPANYPTDISYQTAIRDMLGYLYNGFFKPHWRPMFANVISLSPVSIWPWYMDNLDGAMSEAWATGWGDSSWRTVTQWNENLDRATQTQGRGKWIIGVGQGNKANYSRQRFAYASFLLVDNGRMFFRYADPATYTSAWVYANYLLDLGVPLGARYQNGSQWCRDYSKGKVCVDPAAHTSSINVNP